MAAIWLLVSDRPQKHYAHPHYDTWRPFEAELRQAASALEATAMNNAGVQLVLACSGAPRDQQHRGVALISRSARFGCSAAVNNLAVCAHFCIAEASDECGHPYGAFMRMKKESSDITQTCVVTYNLLRVLHDGGGNKLARFLQMPQLDGMIPVAAAATDIATAGKKVRTLATLRRAAGPACNHAGAKRRELSVLKRAAGAGYRFAPAQYALRWLNSGEGLVHVKQAAMQLLPSACEWIGSVCSQAAWLRIAADLGSGTAAVQLGTQAWARDGIRCAILFNAKAVDLGHYGARYALAHLIDMPPLSSDCVICMPSEYEIVRQLESR